MFTRVDDIKPFESKVWLASPTMHGEELKYVTEAYETNWMSTVVPILMSLSALLPKRQKLNMQSPCHVVRQRFIFV